MKIGFSSLKDSLEIVTSSLKVKEFSPKITKEKT